MEGATLVFDREPSTFRVYLVWVLYVLLHVLLLIDLLIQKVK